MKTYTKQWYRTHELSMAKFWYTEEGGDIRLLLVSDDSIPALPEEMKVDASTYLQDKAKRDNQIRVVALKNIFPLYEYYSRDEAEIPYQSMENDVKSTLINRLRIFEMFPEGIRNLIPDKRLAVMGYVPESVKKEIIKYCDGLWDLIKDTEETDAENQRVLKKLTAYWQLKKVCSFSQFVDVDPIKKDIMANNDIKMIFSSGDTLILKDSSVISREQGIIDSVIRGYEFYEKDGNYELHLLFRKYDENLMEEIFYAIYSFKDMEVKFSEREVI